MGTERAGRAEVRAMQWAQQLGVERHTRDECAAQKAKSEEEDATRANTVSLERWGRDRRVYATSRRRIQCRGEARRPECR
jgi:hypothetical protein